MTVGDTFTAGVSTFSDHVGLTSTVYLSDTAEFRIGANNDAIIYSDGTKMTYYHGTGAVVAFESNFGIDIGGIGGGKAFSYRVASQAAELYHNNSLKITTDKHGAIITGIATATSFVKSGGTSSQYLMANGTVTTGISDLGINATQRLLIQVSNGDTDILAAGNSGEYLISAGAGSAPTWSSDLTTTKIRAASFALGNVFAHVPYHLSMSTTGVKTFNVM